MVYIIGVMAAVALPAYQDYTVRAKLTGVVLGTELAREKLTDYYLANHKIPYSLATAGVESQLPDGSTLSLDPKRMALTVMTKQGEVIFVPSTDAHGGIVWTCTNGERIKPSQLPASCRQPAAH